MNAARTLGAKAIACLEIATQRQTSDEWRRRYDAACAAYSEKAVLRMFDRLVARGYLECGVSARTGWLTDKGRTALAAHL